MWIVSIPTGNVKAIYTSAFMVHGWNAFREEQIMPSNSNFISEEVEMPSAPMFS